MITDYAGSTFFPYILTNEFGGSDSVFALQTFPPAPARGLHIGVSGFFNYDLIAARKPSHALLVDCNPCTAEIHTVLEKAISTTSDPKSCLSLFLQMIDRYPVPAMYYAQAGSSKKELLQELSRPASWLASQETFSTIQRFYREKRIEIWIGNLLDPKTISFLQNKIKKQQFTLDTLYLSNCEDGDWEKSGRWYKITPQAAPLFPSIRQAVRPLLQPTSYVLVARGGDWLAQKISRSDAYLQGKNEYVFRYRHPIKLQCIFFLDQHKAKLCTAILVIFFSIIVWRFSPS